MLKQAISILFIFAVLAQLFSRPLVYVSYYMNTASFEKNCINKTRPEKQCYGRCQIVIRMQQEEEKNERKNAGQKNNPTADWTVERDNIPGTGFQPQFITLNSSLSNRQPIPETLTGYVNIFHPPRV